MNIYTKMESLLIMILLSQKEMKKMMNHKKNKY